MHLQFESELAPRHIDLGRYHKKPRRPKFGTRGSLDKQGFCFRGPLSYSSTRMAPPALQPQLQTKLDEYRSARAFNPATWIEAKCAKLNAYMSNAGLKTCVTSVSGGIDSAVVLALTAHAKKMASSPIVNVIGVCQPIHSSAWALERGRENVESCGATLVVIDQTDLHTQLQVFLVTVTD